jgi:uncharacterized tellurite resistance protein B-like protein
MVPIALASAVWYAGLTWVGVALGEEWDAIARFVGQLNVGMAIFGLVVVAAFVVWRLVARRRNRRAELLAALHAVLLDAGPDQPSLIRAGAATLLTEIARADATLGRAQLADIETCLREHWTAELPVVPGNIRLPKPRSTGEVAAIVVDRYAPEIRASAMARLREVLRADERLTPHQQRLLGRAAELLGVSAEESVKGKGGPA